MSYSVRGIFLHLEVKEGTEVKCRVTPAGTEAGPPLLPLSSTSHVFAIINFWRLEKLDALG